MWGKREKEGLRSWRELPHLEVNGQAYCEEQVAQRIEQSLCGVDRERLEFSAADAIRAHAMGVRLG